MSVYRYIIQKGIINVSVLGAIPRTARVFKPIQTNPADETSADHRGNHAETIPTNPVGPPLVTC